MSTFSILPCEDEGDKNLISIKKSQNEAEDKLNAGKCIKSKCMSNENNVRTSFFCYWRHCVLLCSLIHTMSHQRLVHLNPPKQPCHAKVNNFHSERNPECCCCPKSAPLKQWYQLSASIKATSSSGHFDTGIEEFQASSDDSSSRNKANQAHHRSKNSEYSTHDGFVSLQHKMQMEFE